MSVSVYIDSDTNMNKNFTKLSIRDYTFDDAKMYAIENGCHHIAKYNTRGKVWYIKGKNLDPAAIKQKMEANLRNREGVTSWVF